MIVHFKQKPQFWTQHACAILHSHFDFAPIIRILILIIPGKVLSASVTLLGMFPTGVTLFLPSGNWSIESYMDSPVPDIFNPKNQSHQMFCSILILCSLFHGLLQVSMGFLIGPKMAKISLILAIRQHE